MLETPHGVDEPAGAVGGEIDLRGVAGDHHLRAEPEPGEEHLHLRDGRVLCLVEDDEGVVERPPAHVRQRHHLHHVLLPEPFEELKVDQFAEGVEDGAEVGIDLGLEIAGQVAKAFPGFDRGADEDDLPNLLGPPQRHRHRHGEKGLSTACRTVAENDIMFADRPHVGGLSLRARHDVPAGAVDVDRLMVNRSLFTGHHGDCLRDIGAIDAPAVTGHAVELLEDGRGPLDGPLFPLDADRVFARRDVHAQRRPDPAEVLVPRAENGQDPLGVDHRDRRAGHRSPRRMRRRRSREEGMDPESLKYTRQPTPCGGRASSRRRR